MKHWIIIALLAAAPLAARAQQASEAETRLLGEIAECLQEGLPRDWRQAEMLVDLKSPAAETGHVRYLMMRNLSGGQYETFLPCKQRNVARMLVVEMRKLQPKEKRGWKSARFVIQHDGKFDLTLDYSKSP
jgi:hypothetical protein